MIPRSHLPLIMSYLKTEGIPIKILLCEIFQYYRYYSAYPILKRITQKEQASTLKEAAGQDLQT